jgi:DNA-binding transcriptional LysR family regulator
MDTGRIDLNLLRVFHAILEEGNLTLAAVRLGLSQPAVSYALGRLRALFNDPLFIRTGNEMQPTSAALEMREPIRRAMAATQDALRLVTPFDPARSTRQFRLTLSDIGELVFLPPLCSRMETFAPGAHLDVQSVPASQVEEALRSGKLDVAIGNLPMLRERTPHHELFREAYVCMTRRRRGLPTGNLSLDEYLSLSHVLVTSLENAHQQIEDNFRRKNVHRKIALRVPHFTVVPHILARTDWIVTLPRRAAPFLNVTGEFAVFELPIEIPEVSVTVHWHEQFEHNAANRWLREQVIETLGEQTAGHENRRQRLLPTNVQAR